MTTTATIAARPHTLVQRQGPRTGYFHAAVWDLDAEPTPEVPVPAGHWRTACGEDLRPSPRGEVVPIDLPTAVALLDADDPLLCARCSRVGHSTTAGAQ